MCVCVCIRVCEYNTLQHLCRGLGICVGADVEEEAKRKPDLRLSEVHCCSMLQCVAVCCNMSHSVAQA